MAEPRSAAPRIPFILLLVALLVAAVIGGVVARMLPIGAYQSAQPRMLAGPADDSLAPLVRKTSPAVVNIATLLPSPAEQNPLLQDPFFRRYFGVPDAALQPAMAAGSGVIVDGKRGLIITNFHVVRNAEAVQVTLKDGRKFAADPVGLDPNLDLAVLRIGAKDLPTLPLGDSSKLQVGDYVVAIGNPFGLGQTVTSGIISATDRPLGQGDPRRFIQTDAPINPGNSGGALIDLHGELVGINSALFSPSQSESSAGNVGIGFAIPSNVVKQVLAEAERASARQ
jgi:S1-C subfamily serine protease